MRGGWRRPSAHAWAADHTLTSVTAMEALLDTASRRTSLAAGWPGNEVLVLDNEKEMRSIKKFHRWNSHKGAQERASAPNASAPAASDGLTFGTELDGRLGFWALSQLWRRTSQQLFGLASPNLHIPPTTSIPTVSLLHLGGKGVAPLLEEMLARVFQLFWAVLWWLVGLIRIYSSAC